MSYPQKCDGCRRGNHDHHDPDQGVTHGVIGGAYCPCKGGCNPPELPAFLNQPRVALGTGGHGGPLPIVIGPCMHGEVECTPARHATCRHCGLPIKVVQSWCTQTWQHEVNGGVFLACPTTQAEPSDISSGGTTDED